ncbi:tetratricopeptide repeat protein [Sphingomonas sp.]|uniref:tetratricopeptide repeat protein n=1 Tax=Sphingomonas sp. TaxID=28214 RepID=UPI0035A97B4D
MMGWVMLAVVTVLAAGLLVALRVPRLLWTTAGAALVLGCAGYAAQGRPGLGEAKPRPQARSIETAPDLIALRTAMWGKFTVESQYEVAFDALMRVGDARSAVKLAIGGVTKYPDSAELWTDLGSGFVTHDGSLSPPARFAFDRAITLAPQHPAPRFFRGLGHVQSGQLAEARADWVQALTLTPANAPYRAGIEERLAVLDQFIAMAAQAQAQIQAEQR